MNFERIKQDLQSGTLKLQTSAVESINSALDLSEATERSKLVDKLIYSDIARVICTKTLSTSSSQLMKSILDIVEAFTESGFFFRTNLCMETVDMLLKIGLMIGQKQNSDEELIRLLTKTLIVIFKCAEERGKTLPTICSINRVMKFASDLTLSNVGLRFSKANLALMVLHHGELITDGKKFSELVGIYKDSIESMFHVIEAQNTGNDVISQRAVCIITNLCFEASRLSQARHLPEIITRTSITISKIICPSLKTMDLSNQVPARIFPKFVDCLIELYAIDSEDIRGLSKELALQGFLKIFFIESKKPNLAKNIHILLSKILVNLSTEYLPMDDYEGGSLSFENHILKCFQAFVNNTEPNIATIDAILLIDFFNHNATGELIEMRIEKMIELIRTFDKGKIPQVPMIKVIWLLFSELMISPNTDNEVSRQGSEVLLKLFKIIVTYGVEKCYFHHPSILYFALVHPIFPVEFRTDVLGLYLKSDSVQSLPFDVCGDRMIRCLLNIIESSPEKLVEIALREIRYLLIDDSRRKEARRIAWKRLTRMSMNYSKAREPNLRGFLKLIDALEPGILAEELMLRSTISLHKTLDREQLEIETKTLIINQICQILKQSLVQEDPRVVTIFAENKKVLQDLCDDANLWGNDEKLAIACFKCLKQILICQAQFSLKCDAPVTISLMDIEVTLGREPSVALEALYFLKFILCEVIEFPVIRFTEIKGDTEAKKIISLTLYPAIIEAYERIPSERWNVVYQCLAELNKFCRRQKYDETLKSCIDDVANCDLINWTIDNRYFGDDFILFVTSWLKTCVELKTSNVEFILEGKRVRKLKPNAIRPILPFEKTVSRLLKFVKDLISSNKLQVTTVNSLMNILSLFE